MSIGGYDEAMYVDNLMDKLYMALDIKLGLPDCSDCCAGFTPVVCYSEAVYIRDRLHTLGWGVKQQVLALCKEWCRQETDPLQQFLPGTYQRGLLHMTEELKRSRCPFFVGERCLLHPLQPLHCRTLRLPKSARQPVDAVVGAIFAALPQRTGFLPAQLYALLDLEAYTILSREFSPKFLVGTGTT